MFDPGLEPGDAWLVELTLAVHNILLTNIILSQGDVDCLRCLAAESILVAGGDIDGKVSRGSSVGLDLVIVHPGGAILFLILRDMALVSRVHIFARFSFISGQAGWIVAIITIADVAEVTPQVSVPLLTWPTVSLGTLGRSSGVGPLKLPYQSCPATLYHLEPDLGGGLLLRHLPHHLGQHTAGGGLDNDGSSVATFSGPGPPGLGLLLPPLQLPVTIGSVEWH